MDRSIDSGISEQLQPQADSNGFVNRRSVGSIPTTGSEFRQSAKCASPSGNSSQAAPEAETERAFLLALVSASFRSHVSANDKADCAADRFLSHIDRSGGADACWPWLGKPSGNGYGRFKFAGRSIGAHRIACMVAHGDPPAADSQACHDPRACVTRRCCNPKHLRWDSPAGNQADTRIALTRRGSRNPQAKLSEAQVLEVWGRRNEGGYTILARKLGLPVRAVCSVLNGTTWAWLTGAPGRPIDPRALAAAILDAAAVTP